VRKTCELAGIPVAISEHWAKGGQGALELADAVINACQNESGFEFL